MIITGSVTNILFLILLWSFFNEHEKTFFSDGHALILNPEINITKKKFFYVHDTETQS